MSTENWILPFEADGSDDQCRVGGKGAQLGNNDFAFLGGFRMWRKGGIGVARSPARKKSLPAPPADVAAARQNAGKL